MNNNRKWLVAIGIVGVLCLCAGVVSALVFGVGISQLTHSIKTDSASVAATGQRIADFDIPAGYKETVGMSFLSYDMVMIVPDTYDSGDSSNNPDTSSYSGMTIMLMQFNSGLTDPAQMQQQMQRTFEQQGGQRGMNMTVAKTYETTIRGQKATVTVYESDTNQGYTLRQLITIFQGKHGTVMLMMQGSTETWDQSLADQFIASIR